MEPFAKYDFRDGYRYSGEIAAGKKYELRSNYSITGRYNDRGKYCFREQSTLDRSKSVLRGRFDEAKDCGFSEGRFELVEKSRDGGSKRVLRGRYRLHDSKVVSGEYRYFEKYKQQRSKIYIRGTYIIDGYSDQLVQHFTTQGKLSESP